MNRNRTLLVAAVAVLTSTGLAAAQQSSQSQGGQSQQQMMQVDKLVSRVLPTEGNEARGIVVFTKEGDGVKVEAHLQGLEPNSVHGFHVHQYGDARSSDATSAGGHYNPEGNEHGLPPQDQQGGQQGQNGQSGQSGQSGSSSQSDQGGQSGQQQGQGQQGSQKRHAGDLGNIRADEQGVASKTITVQNISLAGQKAPIIGRAVMVHENRDTGQGKSGEAGSRIAMGIIGVANPQASSPMMQQGGESGGSSDSQSGGSGQSSQKQGG